MDLSKDGDVVWSKVRCDGIERTTPFSVIGAKGSAREWLSIEDWDADIIDLGAGGEPWGAWDAILENFGGNAVTVFMSFKSAPLFSSSKPIRMEAAKTLGIPESWRLWRAENISNLSVAWDLARPMDYGFQVVEAGRVGGPFPKDTWHVGVRLAWKT